jgi:hypothetical protein
LSVHVYSRTVVNGSQEGLGVQRVTSPDVLVCILKAIHELAVDRTM